MSADPPPVAPSAAAAPHSLPYMPELDGLRALAVLAVLASHWLLPFANLLGHVGLAGVYVFFVLSGFLITRLLVTARDQIAAGKLGFGAALGRFFGRRVLRIFPAYYLTVIGSYLLSPEIFGRDLPWNLAYLGNMRAVLLGKTTSINHLWSLGVEEQFYLGWPFLVLLVPAAALPRVVVILVMLGPIWRCIAIAAGWRHIVFAYPVWSNLDALGLGALLAVTGATGASARDATNTAAADATDAGPVGTTWTRWAGAVGGVLLLGCALVTYFELGGYRASRPGLPWALVFVVFPLAVSLFAVHVIRRAAEGWQGPIGAVLRAPPLRWVGMISYGIYLYHFVIQGLFDYAYRQAFGERLSLLPRFVALTGVTIAIAALLWLCFERPLVRLGRRGSQASAISDQLSVISYQPGSREASGLRLDSARAMQGRRHV